MGKAEASGIDAWHLTPKSSHVEGLAWEPVGQIVLEGDVASPLYKTQYGELYVAFKAGTVYAYEGVSELDYELLKRAKSVGGALHRLGITNPRGRRQRLVGRFDPETGIAIRR